MSFTRDELVDAITAAELLPRETPRSITVPELARKLGVAEVTARKLVRRALDEGVIRAERVVRLNMGGSYQSVYGYVLVGGEKAPGRSSEPFSSLSSS